VWADLLASAAQLAPVLVHGDIHEDQLLADGGRLTGIIDWETARVDHPFWDFDLGEWDTGLWQRRRCDFSALWARGWRAYAQAPPHPPHSHYEFNLVSSVACERKRRVLRGRVLGRMAACAGELAPHLGGIGMAQVIQDGES
jgi:hypothetical protein